MIEESSLPPSYRALLTESLYLLPRISWWLADGSFSLYESTDCPRMAPTLLDIYVAPAIAAMFPDLHATTLRHCGRSIAQWRGSLHAWANSVRRHEYRCFNPADASTLADRHGVAGALGRRPKFAADMYPVVKRVLQWGERELDRDRDGIPDVHGVDQGWDTFPMYGAASYIADQWIAGLLAGESLARRFGDAEFAAWCVSVRKKASATAENVLWNGKYYDLAHDPATGKKSDICFADQFTEGTVPAGILGLGDDIRATASAPPRTYLAVERQALQVRMPHGEQRRRHSRQSHHQPPATAGRSVAVERVHAGERSAAGRSRNPTRHGR